MRFFRYILCVVSVFLSSSSNAQSHQSKAEIRLDIEQAVVSVYQEIIYYNSSENQTQTIVLNDWNNAFSSKKSPLANRFSDEFVRSFYYASDKELGNTTLISVTDQDDNPLEYERVLNQIDLVEVLLKNPIDSGEKTVLKIRYQLKIPSSKFTGYGYSSDGKIEIKDWILFPARLESNDFVRYSNENLDDAPNALTDFYITLETSENVIITSNLALQKETDNRYVLQGKSKNAVHLIAEKEVAFQSFKNQISEVETNLFDKNIDPIFTAIIIDKIVHFVDKQTGGSRVEKLVISETDYKRNPFYGLNQLPSFLRPFPDSFLYEIKFLKTYSENYLKATLNLDFRKDNWLVNAIEMHLLTAYLEEYYPDMKMLGNISEFGILKGFYGTKMDFEDQFYYLYLMMARRNLDQPTGLPKNELIKFNEQISGKYKAGLDLRYLDDFLGNDIVKKTIKDFFALNAYRQTSEEDFKKLVEQKSHKNIDWYFDQVVHSRNLIDYKISKVKKEKDSLEITLRNQGQANVPISLFGLKKNQVVFKKWFENIAIDSTFYIEKGDFDKLVVNYDGKVPEHNQRNNFKTLKGFPSLNRPLKFTFFKDFEDPKKNQVFFVPEYRYNLYDGIAPGISFSSKSMLKKPFVVDISPFYSFLQKSLVGSGYVGYEHLIREGNLYSVNFGMQGVHFHYAPDASYSRLIPSVLLKFREPDFRENKHQFLYIRHVNVLREKSDVVSVINQEKYSILNIRYNTTKNEITNYFSFSTDVQVSNLFGKISSQVEFRKLYESNRQLNVRFFGGTFLQKNTDSEFFSFATDRPTDYLFDYNFYGRSETKGFFSQQYITADGGFKSKLTPYANQWIVASNISFNIWNWIEVYSDFGLIKNKYVNPEFLYDSGIRLNLVPDYFEVYFPVYSKLGWEVAQPDYSERIRFVITIQPNVLINLFTRKWL
ncbi:MAG: aminopeptidase [Flavobacteriaceae bacterium]